MPTLLKNNIYETPQAIGTSVPYARIDPYELSLIIRRFVSLSRMFVTPPPIRQQGSAL
jgi:hypothetical protein